MAIPVDPVVIDLGEDCCCEDCLCVLCGVDQCDDFQAKYITLTGGTGQLARWLTEGGGGFPVSHLNDGYAAFFGFDPLSWPGPDVTWSQAMNDTEFAGVTGSLSLGAFCRGNALCVRFGSTFMVFGDATSVSPHCASDCDEDDCDGFPDVIGTVTYGDMVCDEDGFVSQDFTITSSEGTLTGTIHR